MSTSLSRFSLAGKVAVVTGSGRGLGRAIAKGMAEAGAAIVTSARTASDADSAAAEIRAAGGRSISVATDVADPSACAALIEKAVAEFGRLDILVCNAGIIMPNLAERATADELEQTLRTNVGGYFYCAQAAERQMTRQGGGSIVMTSSNASLVAFPELLTYNISKGGVDQMVRTLALEWGERNIRVNAFNPGYLEHVMRAEKDDRDPEVEEMIRRNTPMRRRGRVEEVVSVAIFLASDASSFITGTVLPVDGGWCAV
ncbi:MAG TPA: SDR family NAD(P)-dependent oxidoreductase [Dongiaceae bacterium]|jgi:NAD(P)-dependent dehydrogenase (short-subunit alcohol dehydrogenase family)|nr:SDR family NAD(P)-dependent oxidoreductase [Dongiaceae bacterium]